MTDIQAALKKDVDAEIHAIDQYQDQIERIELKPVGTLLQRIVDDEQAHLKKFQELLDQTHGESAAAHRPEKEVTRVVAQLQDNFPAVDIDEVPHTEEEALYRNVRDWAQEAVPSMLPVIDRILAQEQYHLSP